MTHLKLYAVHAGLLTPFGLNVAMDLINYLVYD